MNIKKILFSASLSILACTSLQAKCQENDYTILASNRVKEDTEWLQVVKALQDAHPEAEIIYYENHPEETLQHLQVLRPRYVAIVEQPEAIGKQYIMKLNQASRKVDNDIYEDFMYGIITGYNAKAALRMVNDARTPLVMRDGFATIQDLGDGKWFNSYAYLIDQHPGGYYVTRPAGEKATEHQATDSIANHLYQRYWNRLVEQWGDSAKFHVPASFSVMKPNTLKPFCDLYESYDADVVFTASHATERNLEMPYSTGNILCKDGKLFADFPDGAYYLKESSKPKVYLPIGNCLIGNVNNTAESMACAWMNSGHASTMVGYVVPTWYGRNGWGGLRTLVTQSGRYTVAEAFYVNRQDLLYRLQENAPDLVEKEFPFNKEDDLNRTFEDAVKAAGRNITEDEIGQWYDRDIVAYYGDPAWNARLQTIADEEDVTVTMKVHKKRCTITIKTSDKFSAERMAGGNLPKENLQEQPFTYLLEKRVKNPRLAEGQNWKAAVDENFLFLYDTDFKPSSTYKVVLDCDGCL